MNVREGIEGLRGLPSGAVLSVGNFDGIHLGHRRLLELAMKLRADAGGGVAVVTFEPHPLTVLRPQLAPPRLTAPAVKRKLLEDAGVDEYVVLPPRPEVLNLSAEDFWAILRDQVRPAHMIEGRTFNFGKGRGGNIDRLREWASQSDVKLHVFDPVTVPLLDLSVVPVSSSLIRWLLAWGRVRDAAICLGRAYSLRGKVIKGFQRGRKIGIPTANLACEDDQLIPMDGVYVGRCAVAGKTYPAAVSIGNQPTFEQQRHQVEAHLFGFEGDLYDATIELELIDWIREHRKFAGIDALKAQLARDIAVAAARSQIVAERAIAMAC
jgi:riboflavin kinase/FMN adenylyltransferase